MTDHPGGPAGAYLAQRFPAQCPCLACIRERDDRDPAGFPIAMTMMIVCMTCGNKRCPHANDHRTPCTASNQPGQPGSAYP